VASKKLELIITAKDQASQKLGGIGKALGGLGRVAGIGAAGLVAAGAGMGAALGKLAIDAAPLENISLSFENIAGQAGYMGDEMLDALQKSSAGLITNRDLMTSFNKAAQLVGQDFAVQLPGAMEYLSKVSAATGQDMNFMMDSLVTGVGRMSPMILDNLGIQVALSEATARASEMFGVEADQLTKAQQQAGMMDVVMQKLAENTAAMPEVAGSSAAAFGQIATTMQNLKDQVGLALLPVLGPLAEHLGALATEYGPQVVAIFQEFATKLQEVLPPAIMMVNDALTRIGSALGLTSEDVSGMDVVMAALKGTLDAVIIGIQLGAVAMQGLAAAVEGIVGFVNSAIEAFEKLKATIKGIKVPEINLPQIGGGGGGLFGKQPGFQHGGAFVVGGAGGPDSQMVAFAASPGERVSVAPGSGGGGGAQIIQLVVDGQVLAQVVNSYLGRSARQGARMGGQVRR